MNIDSTRPHIGRIYDFMLGGNHNFEVDRAAAEVLLQVVPIYPELARLNRWFLQLIAMRWAQAKVDKVLDLASGLPTQGHFNDYLPDARILFSDNDPLSVSYGQEILRPRPHQRYIHADLQSPQPLFAEAAQFLGTDQRLAVGFIGVSYMLPDSVIKQVAQLTHAFCAPGSVLAMTCIDRAAGQPQPSEAEQEDVLAKIERLARVRAYVRSPEQTAALLAPWRIVEQNPLEDWLDMKGFTGARLERRPQMDIELYGLIATR